MQVIANRLKNLGIRHQIIGAISILLLLVAAFIFVFFPLKEAKQMNKYLCDKATGFSEMAAKNSPMGYVFNDKGMLNNVLTSLDGANGVAFVLAVNANGQPLASLHQDRVSSYTSAIQEGLHVGATTIIDGGNVVISASPVFSGKIRVGAILVAVDKQGLRSDIAESRWIALAIGVIIIVVGTFFGLGVAKLAMRPIGAMSMVMKSADLQVQFNSSRLDEIGDLQRAFDKFVASIRETLLEVSSAATAVASASSQISSSTEEMAAGAREQTSQAAEVAGAVEEMTRTIMDNSKHATAAAEAARKARLAAEDGVRISEGALESIQRNVEIAGEVGTIVNELGNSSEKIGTIITVIDDIADQTNLLALNAAIEAARAGEQGRGFAVVADEVRKLAERTTKATKEIADLIKSIQGLTGQGVSSMQKANVIVNDNRDKTNKTAESLQGIAATSTQVTDIVMQIEAASVEQSSASEQISKNVEAISTVTGQTAQGIQQIARASEDLNRLTESLQRLLGGFKLANGKQSSGTVPARSTKSGFVVRENGTLSSGDAQEHKLDVEGAKRAHLVWRTRIQKLVTGKDHIENSELLSHKECQLGKWYYGVGLAEFRDDPVFAKLGQQHEHMHNLLKKAVGAWNGGRTNEAKSDAEEIYKASDEVIGLLDQLSHVPA